MTQKSCWLALIAASLLVATSASAASSPESIAITLALETAVKKGSVEDVKLLLNNPRLDRSQIQHALDGAILLDPSRKGYEKFNELCRITTVRPANLYDYVIGCGNGYMPYQHEVTKHNQRLEEIRRLLQDTIAPAQAVPARVTEALTEVRALGGRSASGAIVTDAVQKTVSQAESSPGDKPASAPSAAPAK